MKNPWLDPMKRQTGFGQFATELGAKRRLAQIARCNPQWVLRVEANYLHGRKPFYIVALDRREVTT